MNFFLVLSNHVIASLHTYSNTLQHVAFCSFPKTKFVILYSQKYWWGIKFAV